MPRPGLVAAGLAAAGLVALVILAALTGLGQGGGSVDWSVLVGPYGRRVVVFSCLQAGLSTLLSLALGALLALGLARRASFPGRQFALSLIATATALPGIVVVFAVVTVYGRGGWIGALARSFGFDPGTWLYGLPGILIAHVFMNGPFCARVLLQALEAVPPEQHRLAAHLGLTPRAVFRHLDLPILGREMPGLAALVFLLCFSSFAVVLTLGGGPDRATLEVAIFEALRVDADFARAAMLATGQLGFGLVLTVVFVALARRPAEIAGAGRTATRPDRESRGLRLFDLAALAIGALVVVPPLVAVALAARRLDTLIARDVMAAAATSAWVALAAASLSVMLAVAIAVAARDLRRHRRDGLGRLVATIAYAPLALPSFALIAGLFGVLRRVVDPLAIGPGMVVLVNALMALPFVVRLVEPPLLLAGERHGQLADALDMRGLVRLRLVDWPLLKVPLRSAFALAAALSLGDLGVIAFFGGPDFETLPFLLYQRLGAYRLDEAAAVALLLALIVFLLSLAAHSEPRRDAEA